MEWIQNLNVEKCALLLIFFIIAYIGIALFFKEMVFEGFYSLRKKKKLLLVLTLLWPVIISVIILVLVISNSYFIIEKTYKNSTKIINKIIFFIPREIPKFLNELYQETIQFIKERPWKLNQ